MVRNSSSKMHQIAFNSDVGEGVGNDHLIMPYISWCNIACGAHAGDEKIIEQTIALAKKHRVKIGAHPSYPDRENFGRLSMNMSFDNLVNTISEQILLVKQKVESTGELLHHVKPHGALYNDAVKNPEVANAILHSLKNVAISSMLIAPFESEISYVCKEELDLKYETFADRNYNADLSLVSRKKKNAVLQNEEEIFFHVKKMIFEKKIKTISGEEFAVLCDTICVHGDHPNSPKIIEFLHREFSRLNVSFL